MTKDFIEILILTIILLWGIFIYNAPNRQYAQRGTYKNRVYTVSEPYWLKDIPGQPLGYGNFNIGLIQKSEYWEK